MTFYKIGTGGCHKRGSRKIGKVSKTIKGIIMGRLYQETIKIVNIVVEIDPSAAASQTNFDHNLYKHHHKEGMKIGQKVW